MNGTWLSTQPGKSGMNPPIHVPSAPSHDGGYGGGVAVPHPRDKSALTCSAKKNDQRRLTTAATGAG